MLLVFIKDFTNHKLEDIILRNCLLQHDFSKYINDREVVDLRLVLISGLEIILPWPIGLCLSYLQPFFNHRELWALGEKLDWIYTVEEYGLDYETGIYVKDAVIVNDPVWNFFDLLG